MNILMTGANGFIGKALCDKLLADGYQVRGAVRGEGGGGEKETGERRSGKRQGARAKVGSQSPTRQSR